MSFEYKKLVHVHFLKQVLLPCNACEVSLYTQEFTDVALVHSAVLRKRNFAILGEWLPGVRYLEVKCMAERRKDFVRCPESGSVRFSEVANVLQLW